MIDTQTALLDILDTAGQEEFSSMQDQWLEEVKQLYEKILRAKEKEDVPIVIAGNKQDLLMPEHQKLVDDAKTFADSKNCPHFLTSAKT